MSKKVVTVEQLLENARQGEALTMQVAETVERDKQDKLTGTAGQVVGFDAAGKAVAWTPAAADVGAATMTQVNAAINTAINSAMEETY